MSKVTQIIKEDAQLIVSALGSALSPLRNSTLLVTGAGGFLCSYILDTVKAFNDANADAPCQLIALDNFKSGLPQRIDHLKGDKNIQFMEHDMRFPLDENLKVDWIIHGASIASPPVYRQFPLETIDVNVNGTRHLLEHSRKNCKGILFLSSSEIYGDPDPKFIPTPETYLGNVSCTGPRACYDESKRLGETLCMTYFKLYQTPVKIIRPFNVFGPGQRLDDGRIIPDLMTAALDGKAITLFSDGRASRSFCYIRDFVRGMMAVLVSDIKGESLNLGNDEEETSVAQLAELVSTLTKPNLKVEYKTSADAQYVTDNPQRRCPDLRKIKSLTNWKPELSLKDGLTRTLNSYKELAAKVHA